MAILAKGSFCGSHLHTNCIRAQECPLCFKCMNYSYRMYKCTQCYTRTYACSCTPKMKRIAKAIERRLKKTAYSPHQSVRPTGMLEYMNWLARKKGIKDATGLDVDTMDVKVG